MLILIQVVCKKIAHKKFNCFLREFVIAKIPFQIVNKIIVVENENGEVLKFNILILVY